MDRSDAPSLRPPVEGETRHTPGPWVACDPGDYSDFDGNSRVVLGAHKRIAAVHRGALTTAQEDDANARLIAAAPDLLEALEQLHIKTVVGTDAERYAALDRAWAAIAKARGFSNA